MKTITNIAADNYSPHGDRISVGWELDGNRYHVWMNIKTKRIDSDRWNDGGTIYKNPPLHVERHAPGHFDTRYLDASTKANAATLAHALAVVERDGLIQQAIDAYHAEEAKKLAEYAAEAKIERIKEAGPELLAALEVFAALAVDAHDSEHGVMYAIETGTKLQRAMQKAKAALAKVNGSQS